LSVWDTCRKTNLIFLASKVKLEIIKGYPDFGSAIVTALSLYSSAKPSIFAAAESVGKVLISIPLKSIF